MSVVDVILCACVIASAVGFLAYQWLAGKSQPACHTIAGPNTTAKGPDVILGPALSRGLARAQARAAN